MSSPRTPPDVDLDALDDALSDVELTRSFFVGVRFAEAPPADPPPPPLAAEAVDFEALDRLMADLDPLDLVADLKPPEPWVDLSGLSETSPTSRASHTHTHATQLAPDQQPIAAFLSELAATSRAFSLYDPRNDAVRNLLSALLRSVSLVLGARERVVLEVRPFEILHEGVTVFQDRDWEGSLAFRLYRDGVRTMALSRGLAWEELTRLLEILSVRFTGVQQLEDDFVTLFWKAGLSHVHIGAVEGLEEIEAERPEVLAGAELQVFDREGPRLPAAAPLVWTPLSEARREGARQEVEPSALPADCLALLDHLVAVLQDADARMEAAEVLHLLMEMQAVLMGEAHLDALGPWFGRLKALAAAPAPGWDPGRAATLACVLGDGARPERLKRLLEALPPGLDAPPPTLSVALAQALPDPLDALCRVLAEPLRDDARHLGRLLLTQYGARVPLRLKLRFKDAQGPLIYDLLFAVAHGGGDEGIPWVCEQLAHADADVRAAATRLLGTLPWSGTLGRAVAAALKAAAGAERLSLLAVVEASGDARFVEPLLALVDQGGLDAEEAWSLGRALGRVGRDAVAERCRPWITPQGLIRKSLPGDTTRQILGASALAEVSGERSLGLLRDALKVASEEVKPWIGRAIARHHGGRGRERD